MGVQLCPDFLDKRWFFDEFPVRVRGPIVRGQIQIGSENVVWALVVYVVCRTIGLEGLGGCDWNFL
jgi:hypothetical protein